MIRRSLLCFAFALAACDSGSGGGGVHDADVVDAGTDANVVDAGSTGDGSVTDGGTNGDGAVSGPTCGDRALEGTEECDDGNLLSGDGCSTTCTHETPPNCGDGVVSLASGEACDDANVVSGDGCSASCLIEAGPSCGNGLLEIALGEECDDAGTAPGDGCGPSCQLEVVGAFCGDSMLDPGEVCDDGNTNGGDACNATCNSTATTSAFVGSPGMFGNTDGTGVNARLGYSDPSTGTSGFSGTLTADATSLWLAQSGNAMAGALPRLRRIDVATATVTTVATLAVTEGIATDGVSRVFVAGGTRIQSILTNPPYTVTDVHPAGTACANAGCFSDGVPGVATFGDVRGLTYYGGQLYIVDAAAAVVRRMDPTTFAVTTIAGSPFSTNPTPVDGIGSAARFTSPRYVVADGSGLLYVSDTNGAAIRIVDARTFAVGTLAGNGTSAIVDGPGGPSGTARVGRPRGITSDGTSVYWVEFNAHVVRQAIASSLEVSTLVGTPAVSGAYAEGVGASASFASPFSIAYHAGSRSLFVVDAGNGLIRRIQ